MRQRSRGSAAFPLPVKKRSSPGLPASAMRRCCGKLRTPRYFRLCRNWNSVQCRFPTLRRADRAGAPLEGDAAVGEISRRVMHKKDPRRCGSLLLRRYATLEFYGSLSGIVERFKTPKTCFLNAASLAAKPVQDCTTSGFSFSCLFRWACRHALLSQLRRHLPSSCL